MILNSGADDKNVFEQKEGDGKKVLKLNASFFTATYFSLMKTNKAKFKMKESD